MTEKNHIFLQLNIINLQMNVINLNSERACKNIGHFLNVRMTLNMVNRISVFSLSIVDIK